MDNGKQSTPAPSHVVGQREPTASKALSQTAILPLDLQEATSSPTISIPGTQARLKALEDHGHKRNQPPVRTVNPGLSRADGPTQPSPRGEKRTTIDEKDEHEAKANPIQERAKPSSGQDVPAVKETAAVQDDLPAPIRYWVRENKWPQEYFNAPTDRLLPQRNSLASLTSKRPNAASSSASTNQRPRAEKSASYRDPRYEILLNKLGSFMTKSILDVGDASKILCTTLLEAEQDPPKNTAFSDEVFEYTCHLIHNRNEARVVQDISRFIVPSAEALAFLSEPLRILAESVNDGWSSSIPLTPTRPQPDYAVGFGREAFTGDQLSRISPYVGDDGDRALFMATYYMYFPFLTCEVKCGAAALEVADRQNAHSMTLSVRAMAELFLAVKREKEVDRQILAFSVSHDHRSVRIHGHYPVFKGQDVEYYRHPIHEFSTVALDGRERWTAYRFTRNVYDLWVPSHFNKICSAIDMLPLPFDDSTAASSSIPPRSVSQMDEASMLRELQGPDNGEAAGITPSPSATDQGKGKRRRKSRK